MAQTPGKRACGILATQLLPKRQHMLKLNQHPNWIFSRSTRNSKYIVIVFAQFELEYGARRHTAAQH